MTEKEKELQEILEQLERDRPEIDRILNKPPIIDTGRKPKPLCCIPKDADFSAKDGNTEYEVVGHFNPDAGAFILNKIMDKLGYYPDED